MTIHLSKRYARPRWSLKESFWVMVILVLFDFTLVCAVLERPLWQEIEVASLIVGVFAWGVLSFLLHTGARMDDDHGWSYASNKKRFKSALDMAQEGNGMDLPDVGGLGDDPISALIAIVLGLIALVLIAVTAVGLLWLGFEVIYAALWLVFGVLFWMYHYALRSLIARHRRAKGRWTAAIWGGFKGGCLVGGGFVFAALLALLLGAH